MFINKKSGDDLALAFAKILNQNKSVFQKNASDCASSADDALGLTGNEAVDMAIDMSMAEDEAADLENMAKDMLLDTDMAADEDDLMDSPDMAEDKAYDAMDMLHDMDMAKHAKLMKGLGKIAGSLRRKGETFAADVVEATALSVRNDIVKEAKEKKAYQIKKANVLRELDSMATRLSKKGNLKAAKEVIKTARKIIKK